MLLLAGQLCTAELWAAQVQALLPVAKVQVADSLGHNTIAAIAADILAKAPVHFALCAHAMGGFIALELLRMAPERVTRLALLDTLAAPDFPVQIERRKGYAKLVESGDFMAVVRARIPLLVHPSRQSDVELVAAISRMAERTGVQNFLQQQHAIMTRADSRSSLRCIRCPTLIVAGDADAIVPLESTMELVESIPCASLAVIKGCGHLTPLERPQEVSDLLRSWVMA